MGLHAVRAAPATRVARFARARIETLMVLSTRGSCWRQIATCAGSPFRAESWRLFSSTPVTQRFAHRSRWLPFDMAPRHQTRTLDRWLQPTIAAQSKKPAAPRETRLRG